MSSDTHTAKPSIQQTRRAIAETATRDAVDHFEDARRLWVERRDALEDDASMDQFLAADDSRLEDARRQLTRAVLAWEEGRDYGDTLDAEKRLARPRGIIHGGRLYAAVPGPDYGMGHVGEREACSKFDVMTLSVVDMADVVDLDAPAAEGPGQAATPLAVPLVPAGRKTRPRPVVKDVDRPLPLLRATHTVCLPSDPWPVTLELVVLALDEGGQTATESDLPELGLGDGTWIERSVGSLEVFTRLVAR